MFSDSGILQLYLTVITVIGGLSGNASGTCVTLLSNESAQHFNAFKSLPTIRKHAFGCAAMDQPRVSSSSTVYQENHVIDIENTRAADIYLNINGIPHRTTDSLPQYDEYRYKFALFSKKDVIWLVSLRNMPNSSVSFQFYFPTAGSQVISREGHKFSTIKVEVDRRYMTAQTLLTEYKSSLFVGEEVTSFSQIVGLPRLSAVDIMVGPKVEDDRTSWDGNFTSRCIRPEKDYESPIVSLKKYEDSHRSSACERKAFSAEAESLRKCYIVDIQTENVTDHSIKQLIALEVVGTEAYEHNNKMDERTIVLLRSNVSTQWRVHISRELQSRKLEFVVGSNGEFKAEGMTEVKIDKNLDIGGNDYQVFARGVEERYGCAIMSYAQYDSPTQLVFLSLSESKDIGGLVENTNDLNDMAIAIFQQCEKTCTGGSWVTFKIPLNVLKEYGLSTSNVEVNIGTEPCNPQEDDNFITYKPWECISDEDDGVAELKVTVQTRGKHLFPSSEAEVESVSIPITECTEEISQTENEAFSHGIRTFCEKNAFFIEIHDNHKQYLDLSGMTECQNSERSNGYTEYRLEDYFGKSCGSTFKNGTFRITIPAKANGDGVLGKPIELSCKPFEVTTRYKLEVFKDYNMRNSVPFGPIFIQSGEVASDETTYHFKVSLASNDDNLMVYLARCSLKQKSRVIQVLIKDNCLVSSIVSFVRSPFDGYSQHFAVNMESIIEQYDELQIECEVDACSKGEILDQHAVKPPQCFHLHGDSCFDIGFDEEIRLASFHPETVVSGLFRSSSEPITTPSPISQKTCSSSINAPILLILTLCAFFMGCIFVVVICVVDKRYKRKGFPDQQKSLKPNSEIFAESGSSRSTGSTKTDGSSFSSLFCPKTGKSSRPSSSSSSKDNLEMKPFIPTPTSATQPQSSDVNSKKITESTSRIDPSSSRLESVDATVIRSSMTSDRNVVDRQKLSAQSSLDSPLCQASRNNTCLSCRSTLSQETSSTPHDLFHGDQAAATLDLSQRQFEFCPVQVLQDAFHKLKEEAV